RRADRQPRQPDEHRNHGRVPKIERPGHYHRHGHARIGCGALHPAQRDFARRKHHQRHDGGQSPERGKGIAAAPRGTTSSQTHVMRIFASLKIAGRALLRNKMRSLLTMLGIIIGVGAVIGSVSLTSGATKQIEDQVSSMGESVITVFSGNQTMGGMRGGWGSAPTLTVADALAIAGLKNVVGVSPEVRDRAQVLANGLNWNTQVMGESPDYPQIRNGGV